MLNLPSPRKRASRRIRPDTPRPMRLTRRDKQVIQVVNDFRVLRQDQIQRLLFPSRNTAQVRLQLLWQQGYLKREFLPVIGGLQTSPILYVLDKRGVELLQHELGYDKASLRWSPNKDLNYQFLEHTLGLAEVRLAVTLSCRRHGFQLKKWLDEKALKADYDRVQVGNKLTAVLPDAFFVIGLPGGEMQFFLEYDRGPEHLKFLKKKLLAYRVYYQSGKCQARYGTDKIRALTVIEGSQAGTGQSRLTNLTRVAKELVEHRWFWFSSLARIVIGDVLLDPIWWQVGSEATAALVAT